MVNIQKTAGSSSPRQQGLVPAIEQALASLKLEGITLSDETIADLMLFSEGKLSEEEAMQKVLARVKAQSK